MQILNSLSYGLLYIVEQYNPTQTSADCKEAVLVRSSLNISTFDKGKDSVMRTSAILSVET